MNTTRILTLEWAIGLAIVTTMICCSARRMRERAVALSLDLLQNTSALASSYPARRKCHLQSPVTVLQFLWMSKTREKASEGLKPENTEASTRWAVKNFTAWAANQRRLVPDNPVPNDLLECHDHAKVCKYLCMFVLET